GPHRREQLRDPVNQIVTGLPEFVRRHLEGTDAVGQESSGLRATSYKLQAAGCRLEARGVVGVGTAVTKPLPSTRNRLGTGALSPTSCAGAGERRARRGGRRATRTSRAAHRATSLACARDAPASVASRPSPSLSAAGPTGCAACRATRARSRPV